MNKNYYIKEIRDLSKNYDRDTQSKILDDLTDKFFDVKGIKEFISQFIKYLGLSLTIIVFTQISDFFYVIVITH